MDPRTLRSKRRQVPVVLIVDDEESVREFLERALATFGYEALSAPDAESALEHLLSHEPHVAILDVHLPGASGLWLADRVRESSPTTAIILATGDPQVPPTESLRPHVIAYLVKPFAADKLRDAIDEGVRWSESRRTQRDLW